MTENSGINKCCVDLESMLDSAEHFPDVVLLVGKHKTPIRAHKCILSLRSPVLKAMLRAERTSSEIEISDIGYTAMKELLRFLYARRVRDIPAIRDELLKAAAKYGVDELKATTCDAAIQSEVYVTFALECRVCHGESSFDDADSLNEHVKAKHADRVRLPASLENGAIEPAAREVYACKLCESVFPSRREVVEHSTKTHREVACKFLCAKCLVSFRSLQLQEDHRCATTRDVDELVNVVVETTSTAPNDDATRENGAVLIERLARFLARREPKKARYEPTRKKHQKTPCPKCRKMFAYRKSLNDHIIFEHIVPCQADEASKSMALELLRLTNHAEASDRAKIEELAIAVGKYNDDEACV